MLITFKTFSSFARGHISANNWEDDLGLSCDVEHVVGFIKSDPPTLAISDKFQGAGREMFGILPNGDRFKAWPVTLHDRENSRAGRRISRKARLKWLPIDRDASVTITPLEGECALIVFDDFETAWRRAPLQHFLLDENSLDDSDFEVDDEQVETSEPTKISFPVTLQSVTSSSPEGRRLQMRLFDASRFFEILGIPLKLDKGAENKVPLSFYAYPDEGVLRVASDPLLGKKITVAEGKWTVSEYLSRLGLSFDSLLAVDEFEAVLTRSGPDDWCLEIDVSDSRYLKFVEPAHADG